MSTDNVGDGDTGGSASAETNDYSDFGRTSCACAQVAGIAALILSMNRDLTWEQVRQMIRDTAVKIDVENTDQIGQWIDTDGDNVVDFSQWYGYGRVDAYRAVQRAWNMTLAPPAVTEYIETIVAAQEAIYMRRLLATMKKFVDECPTPRPSPEPRDECVAIPLKLVQADLNKLNELKALRAKYMSRKEIDRDLIKAVAAICRENAELIDS